MNQVRGFLHTATATLPYPPTTNNAYAVRNGRLVKTTEARDYARDVTERLFQETAWRKFKRSLTGGERFNVIIIVHPPDRLRRDIANTEKLVTDAIFKYLGADDTSIDRMLLERADRVVKGQLIVTVTATHKEETV